MLIIPAIDIREGKVVRFVKGRFKEKIYSSDPVEMAYRWQKEGAKRLHVVDLEGARSGRIKNIFWLKRILNKIDIPVEFGGGIRSIETVKKLLDMGVEWVVIGTKLNDQRFLKQIFRYFGRRIIPSVDEDRGMVLGGGWRRYLGLDTPSLIKNLKEMGFKQFIYTDISRDGTLGGLNIKRINEVLKYGLKVIISGGVSSLEDIQKLKNLERYGLRGVIMGKALYEGRVDLKEAIKIAG